MIRYGNDEGDEYVELDVSCVTETAKAVLLDDGDRKFWVPMSVIEDTDWPGPGESGMVHVKRWFAEKEGLG